MTKEEIKKIRLDAHFTQEKMAKYLGLGAATRISEYESGRRHPSGAAQKLLIMLSKKHIAKSRQEEKQAIGQTKLSNTYKEYLAMFMDKDGRIGCPDCGYPLYGSATVAACNFCGFRLNRTKLLPKHSLREIIGKIKAGIPFEVLDSGYIERPKKHKVKT